MARRAWLASSCAVLWLASVASISSAINSISSRDTRLTNLEDNVEANLDFETMFFEISLLKYLFGVSMSLVGNLSSAWPESETPM